jgi:tetratricopeptide (TPR) repeat protein
LFDLDAKRLGNIQELALGDLSRPEALGLMQKLPHLASAGFNDKLKAYTTFGGHPYALVALDRHCGYRPLPEVLAAAATVHAELREFLAIELNYAKLSERSRELLNRLAAFRQPAPLDAAEWVMGEKILLGAEFLQKIDRNELPEELKNLDDAAILEKLNQFLPERRQAENLDKPIMELISWGLLTPLDKDGQVNALVVHSLVRDFCRDKQLGEMWRTRLRDAAAFYTNQTKLLREDDKTPAAVWNEMEAFELLMEADDFAEAANLLLDAQPILRRWGFGRYLESQYGRLLGKVDRATAANIGHNLGVLFQARGDYAAALAEYEKSLKIKEEIGDRAGVASSLHQIGNLHYLRGDYAAALSEYEKSLKIEEEIGDRAGVANSFGQIALLHHNRGEYDQAITAFQKSLRISEELGDRATTAKNFHNIGMIHQARGDYAAALSEYEKSLKILEEIGDRAGVASSLHQIGMIHQARGDYAAALAEYEKSLKIKEEIGDRAGVAKSLHQIGMIHHDRGDYAAALAEYEKSLKIKEEIGNRAGVASSRAQIGKLFTQTGRYPEAFEYLFFALATFLELQSPNAEIVANMLKELRAKWGKKKFDAAWQNATGEPAPEWVQSVA